MESNPLRGLFGVSSPRPVEQRVAPQPTEPTENVYFEIPSGMIEKLLSNPFTGDGTLYPDLHLIYVAEVCGLFKLAGMPKDVINKKDFPLSFKGKALTWFRLCDDMGSWNYKCRMWGSGKPLRFEHWGAREVFPSYRSSP